MLTIGDYPHRSKWTLWAPMLLAAAGIVTYANSLGNPFVFDDLPAIEENEHIRALWPPTVAFDLPPSPVAGRPVVWLSLALNYAVSGSDVRGFRAANVAIHVLCAIVLFGVVRRTLIGERLRDRFGAASGSIAVAAALLWLVHPLNTEAINYVVQRTESLMALFCLLTLYCAIRADGPEHRTAWCAGAVAACALGMASKESMVAAPVVVILYDLAFLPGGAKSVLARRAGLYAGLAATWLVLVALMLGGPRAGTVGFGTGVTPLTYALNQCVMIARYLRLAAWPHPLTIDYGKPVTPDAGDVAPAAIVVILALVATGIAAVRAPRAGFLLLAVFALLAPTSSVVPIASEVGAERRMYLPLAAILVLAVVIGHRVLRHPRLTITATVLLAGAMAVASARRNMDYASRTGIWEAAAAVVPENPRAHYNLGVLLIDERRLDEADAAFRRTLALDPDHEGAHYNLALTLAARDRREEAVVQFREAVRINPGNARTHKNLASALRAIGREEEAMRHLDEARRLEPGKAGDLNDLGLLLARKGRHAEAIGRFREALAIDATHADAHFNLALSLSATGAAGEALAHLAEARRARPGWPLPWIAAAQILAEHPDPSVRNPPEAIRLAETAVALTDSRDARALAALGASYAAAGDRDRALAAIGSAIGRANASRDARLEADLRRRAEAYRSGR